MDFAHHACSGLAPGGFLVICHVCSAGCRLGQRLAQIVPVTLICLDDGSEQKRFGFLGRLDVNNEMSLLRVTTSDVH